MSAWFGTNARRALVDSAAYAALSDPRDANHVTATATATWLAHERWQLFTTNFIVAEAHALLLSRRGRSVAARFLHEIDRTTDTTIVRVEEQDEQRAREIIYHYRDKDFSLTDAISFAVMERQAIDYAFTFDRHFLQYGFALVTPMTCRKEFVHVFPTPTASRARPRGRGVRRFGVRDRAARAGVRRCLRRAGRATGAGDGRADG